MKALNLLVYEHVAGGGLADQNISSAILSEGYGMLRTLVSDFKAAGHNVTTFLDSRLGAFNPPIEAEVIIPISSHEEIDKALKKIPQAVDAVYTIAPESEQVLQRLVETVEVSGGVSLNCKANAVGRASNKMTTYQTLKKIGLRVPETLMVDARENIKQIKHAISELEFPIVFKPLCGASCFGLSVVKDESQIKSAVNKITKESSDKFFVAQTLIRGVTASVSLISTDDQASPITLNKQMITLAPPNSDSSYNGGTVPLHHPSEKEALRAAQLAAKSINGLMGYIGVDLILTSKEPVVMEVNPRLTTSYIGFRKVVNFNPAQAIIDAVLMHRLPENVRCSGYASHLKVKVAAPTYEILSKTYGLKEVISPPFPVTGDKSAYALLVSHFARLTDTNIGLSVAKRHLLDAFHSSD